MNLLENIITKEYDQKTMEKDVLLTTGGAVPGHEIAGVLGLIWGSSIKAKHLGKDITMVFKHMVGGELGFYTEMLDEARKAALERMIGKAKEMDADAVTDVRFVTSMVMQGAAEMMVYGTAVKLKKI